MTIKQALNKAAKRFADKKILSPGLDADVLLAYVLKKDRSYLYTYPNKKLTASQQKKFNQLISMRNRYWPIAYLTGEKEFYKLPIRVNQKVIIPRPETELMVNEILKLNKNWTVADIGTGSGCIAIALAKNGFKKIYATDVSKAILFRARQNSKLNNVSSKIKFIKGNLFDPIKNDKIDIVAANLPYLSEKVYQKSVKLFPEIKKEPKGALIAPLEGLYYYQQLLRQISNAKHLPKYLFFEIDPDQSEKIKRLIKNYFKPKSIKIKNDLCNKDRLVIVRL